MTPELTDEVLSRLEGHANYCTGTETYVGQFCEVAPDELLALLAAARRLREVEVRAKAVVSANRSPHTSIADKAISELERYLR